ncbi:hypothetical protein E2C01_011945 [Portunus trituberculatus]|uniref:Uncharacterized protein n=1 Tax=Portunus trituberculatus TaxID=210409 RepID=A0A5B7DCT5_PORTR|nr:hypothetical protein [Portunus trituberculatus]
MSEGVFALETSGSVEERGQHSTGLYVFLDNVLHQNSSHGMRCGVDKGTGNEWWCWQAQAGRRVALPRHSQLAVRCFREQCSGDSSKYSLEGLCRILRSCEVAFMV